MDVKEFASKGGLARAKKMTKEERSESARKAARARHAKRKDKTEAVTEKKHESITDIS